MTEPTPPRRRWFRYSLRTLLLSILVLAIPIGWLAMQLKWIHDRRTALWQEGHWARVVDNKPPWSLRMFDEQGVQLLVVRLNSSDEENERVARLFPEAEVIDDPDLWETPSGRNQASPLGRPTPERTPWAKVLRAHPHP